MRIFFSVRKKKWKEYFRFRKVWWIFYTHLIDLGKLKITQRDEKCKRDLEIIFDLTIWM